MVPHADTIVTFADLHRQDLLAWPRVSHRRVVRRHEVPSSPRNDSKEPKMSTTNRSRSLFIGSAVVFAFTLLAPVTVMAEEEVAAQAPVCAPSVDATNAGAVRAAARVLAAREALLSPDLGSLQEGLLLDIVAAAPSSEATSDSDEVSVTLTPESVCMLQAARRSTADLTMGSGLPLMPSERRGPGEPY
jgi:hypothetical protein